MANVVIAMYRLRPIQIANVFKDSARVMQVVPRISIIPQRSRGSP